MAMSDLSPEKLLAICMKAHERSVREYKRDLEIRLAHVIFNAGLPKSTALAMAQQMSDRMQNYLSSETFPRMEEFVKGML